jgi:glutathione S-transferase
MDAETKETYQLFKTDLCGFCHRVRHFLDSHEIDVQLRDTMREADAFRELLQGGGRTTVPCLRIERADSVEWMYESMDIMRYLAVRHNL